jgi:membrane-associated phospholipid phosphatase
MAARLRPADLLVLLFSTVLAVVSLIAWIRIPVGGRRMIAVDILLIAFVLILRPGAVSTSSRLAWLADFYFAPVIYLFYEQACMIARSLHNGNIYDTLLVNADHSIFGTDPTRWLASHTNPFVTEILQVAYASFYLLLLLVAWDLLRSGKRQEFDVFAFGVVYGFGLSYLGYWLLPSVGPRFVLHDFSKLDSQLPGLIFTPYLRAFVNWGGAIAPGASNQSAMAKAYPDVFPSGHAMMTMALIFWSFRFSSGVRWFILGAGSLLIVSTVYLRYHYVIDVFAGAGLAVFCLATHTRLYQLGQRLLTSVTENLERSA